jgi:hypothetical protein
MVYLSKSGKEFTCTNFDKKPIDYIVIAVVLCLGHEIINKSWNSLFENVCCMFSNKRIRIFCTCDDENKSKFNEIVSNCYILQNLKFEVETSFAD